MNHTTLTRPELITILLANYEDVLNGLRDTKGDGVHLPLMCAAYNSPAYRQLERQLHALRTQEPTLYRHLAGTHDLATLQPALEHPHVQAPLALLRGAEWQLRLAALPGYRVEGSGDVLSLRRVLPWWTWRKPKG